MWLSLKVSRCNLLCRELRVTWAVKTLCLALLSLSSPSLVAQQGAQHNAFRPGEELVYRVDYDSPLGTFNAGSARVVLTSSSYRGNPVLHVVGTGETNSFFDVFYKIRDRFETRMDPESLLPFLFIRRTKEGDYVYDDDVEFDRNKGIAISRRAIKPIPPDARDIISAVYFMRTLDVADFGDDSLYHINFYLDDSLYRSVVRFAGRAVVETEWGYLPCLKIIPMVVTGEVFARKFPMTVWVTDDQNHIPVVAESEILVGSLRMELSDYSNLKNPFIKPLSRKEIREFKK